eukprot:scaffold12850_cov109-Isochrysis_galbana.AAC.3
MGNDGRAAARQSESVAAQGVDLYADPRIRRADQWPFVRRLLASRPTSSPPETANHPRSPRPHAATGLAVLGARRSADGGSTARAAEA